MNPSLYRGRFFFTAERGTVGCHGDFKIALHFLFKLGVGNLWCGKYDRLTHFRARIQEALAYVYAGVISMVSITNMLKERPL